MYLTFKLWLLNTYCVLDLGHIAKDRAERALPSWSYHTQMRLFQRELQRKLAG